MTKDGFDFTGQHFYRLYSLPTQYIIEASDHTDMLKITSLLVALIWWQLIPFSAFPYNQKKSQLAQIYHKAF